MIPYLSEIFHALLFLFSTVFFFFIVSYGFKIIIYRLAKTSLADKPLELFVAIWVGCCVWVALAVGVPVGTLSFQSRSDQDMSIAGMLLLAGSLAPFVVKAHNEMEELPRVSVRCVPKIQFWLQDLFWSLLAYAFVMTLYVNYCKLPYHDLQHVAGASALLFVAQLCNCAIAMDVFRRSHSMKRPALRAIALIFFLILNGIVPGLLAMTAWMFWRSAMKGTTNRFLRR